MGIAPITVQSLDAGGGRNVSRGKCYNKQINLARPL
jgi:hypothetical protein